MKKKRMLSYMTKVITLLYSISNIIVYTAIIKVIRVIKGYEISIIT